MSVNTNMSFPALCVLRALLVAVAICWAATATASGEDGAALIKAAETGDLQLVQGLLDKGADVNTRTAIGYTALIEAVQNGKRDVAELLVTRGADVNAIGKNGNTA